MSWFNSSKMSHETIFFTFPQNSHWSDLCASTEMGKKRFTAMSWLEAVTEGCVAVIASGMESEEVGALLCSPSLRIAAVCTDSWDSLESAESEISTINEGVAQTTAHSPSVWSHSTARSLITWTVVTGSVWRGHLSYLISMSYYLDSSTTTGN